jgi:hypothetical protein
MFFTRWFKSAQNAQTARKQSDAESLDRLAQILRDEGVSLWLDDQHDIVRAIAKVEQSWALKRTADTAIQLGVMYDRANRHQDALSVYRQAFNLFPDHPRLRHEAGITLLRHGAPDDVKAFFRGLHQLDPADAFATFVCEMLDLYPSWVANLVETARAGANGKPIYLAPCAVWGEPFTARFVDNLCASLISLNNLPALARTHSIHFVIFTTAELEGRMKADQVFRQLMEYAAVHFVHYDPAWLRYESNMQENYGPDLGQYYSRTCRFLLFSSAHYVALAAGRALECSVIPFCADVAYADGTLLEIDRLMQKADVVAYWNFNIEGAAARRVIEDRFRDNRGRLVIPVEAFPQLFFDHMSANYEDYFVDSRHFSSYPVYLLWRAGPKAVVVHATHYHPLCIRPSALAPPFELTIDPVDSRFLDKRFADKSRVHFVRDMSIASFTLDEDGAQATATRETRAMSVRDIGLWLWGYWGPWRATTFLAPVCVVAGETPPGWEETRKQAGATAAAIVAEAEGRERGNRFYKSWAVESDRGQPTAG